MDDFVIFSTEQWGFNKDEVAAYTARLHKEYDKLSKKYQSLIRKQKKLITDKET